MGFLGTLLVVLGAVGALGFLPHDAGPLKDHYINDALLRDVVERMGAELSEVADSYVDFAAPDPRLSLIARANKDIENEQLDYDSLMDGNPNPSIRDQEYLQHSSLWGHQYMAGGAGEGEQRLKPNGIYKNQHQVKTDAALPAYCNPPNPCPVGYIEDQGCTSRFENTAAFSREYQSAQACMCDGEHMFDCSGGVAATDEGVGEQEGAYGARATQEPGSSAGMLARQFQNGERKRIVAKKFNTNKSANPYLKGEKLPIAAKKGINVDYRK